MKIDIYSKLHGNYPRPYPSDFPLPRVGEKIYWDSFYHVVEEVTFYPDDNEVYIEVQ